jgi:hypothetical protein
MTGVPRPDFVSFPRWAAQLAVNYSEAEVPIVRDEVEWREFGRALLQRPPFNDFPLPDPTTFTDWRDWARSCALLLGNY